MIKADIEYRDRPRDPVMPWAMREGTKEEIRTSARNLLESMRDEEGLRSPAVFVVWPNGKRERIRAPKGGVE